MTKVIGTKVPTPFYEEVKVKAKERGLNVSQLVLQAVQREINAGGCQ
jgi:hypothetical protein